MLNASFGNRNVTIVVLRHHSASKVYCGLITFNKKVSLKGFLYEVIFLSVIKEPYYCTLKTVAFNYASNSEQSDGSRPACSSHRVTVLRCSSIVLCFNFPSINSAVNTSCEGHAYLSFRKCIVSLRHL